MQAFRTFQRFKGFTVGTLLWKSTQKMHAFVGIMATLAEASKCSLPSIFDCDSFLPRNYAGWQGSHLVAWRCQAALSVGPQGLWVRHLNGCPKQYVPWRWASWHTACRRPCAKLPILGFGGWGGVGNDVNVPWTYPHGWCYATWWGGVGNDVNVPWTYPHGWCYGTWWGGVGNDVNVLWTYPHGWCYATWWGGVGNDVNVPGTYPHGWCYATWWGGVVWCREWG